MHQILEIVCPSCDKTNLLDNGDLSDQTISDVDQFKCWSCKKAFNLDDEGNAGEEITGDDARYVSEGDRPANETDYRKLAQYFRRYFDLCIPDRTSLRGYVNRIVSDTTTKQQKEEAENQLQALLEQPPTKETLA